MKPICGSFFTQMRGKLVDYAKELVEPENLEGIRLNLFGGSIRDHMRLLGSQQQKQNEQKE